MSVLVYTLQGRFGNQVMQYLYCRAFAEQWGYELRGESWIGESVFEIRHPRPDGRPLSRMGEVDLFTTLRDADRRFGATGLPANIEFRGYAQMQQCMIYTKRQAQTWLKLRADVETACAHALLSDRGIDDRIVCHRRVGDYAGYGYPVVSQRSYKMACDKFGLKWDMPEVAILTEEDPTPHAGFLPDDLSFMPDFYRMMVAPTLLRANSSFSWLAALLGDGLVLAPIIEGLEGGKEHDTQFVAGNWPRFANLDFVTDLRVSE